MRAILFAGLGLLSAFSLAAPQSIAGKVLDKSRAPLRNVDVRLLPDTFTVPRPLGKATTDDSGSFHIQAPSAGRYRLMFGLRNASVLSEPLLVSDKDVEQEYLIDVAAEDTYFEFQVEKRAELLPGQPAPRYPQAMRMRNIEGEVLVQFVVDAEGRPQMWTFKVLRQTYPEFTAAVRSAVAQSRFSPAELEGRKVKQLVQMPFGFSLSLSR